MDTPVTTSFIPKKPLAEERVKRPRQVSLFSFMAVLFLIFSIIATGGVFGYRQALMAREKMIDSGLDALSEELESIKSQISEMDRLDRRIKSADAILDNHVAISPIFQFLQEHTLKSIAFTKFNYALSPSGDVTVEMSGRSKTYESIGEQSEEFSPVKNAYIKNIIFSNLNLEEMKSTITFDMGFNLDRSFVSYRYAVANDTAMPAPTQ